jgi:uncharacterized protein with GYD domain
MPKYLVQASYSTEGVRGILKDGGSARRAAVAEAVESVDGKLEAMYFAFSEDDAFVILDLPDNASAAAVSLVVNGSGAAHTKTTVLLTPEEIDQATRKTIRYRPPGQ